jgi:hypothetical protein
MREWRKSQASRILPAIVGIFLSVALAWAADEPWKDKQYQQWDSKDLEKILDNSPWARMVHVDATWKKAGAPAPAVGSDASSVPPSGTSSQPGSTGSGSRGMGGAQPANTSANPSGGYNQTDAGTAAPQPQTATFVVRWASSNVMREAFARNAVLNQKVPEADAEASLEKPVDVYQIVVAGTDMTPFSNLDENALKAGAFLTPKHSKTKLASTAVTIQRAADGKGVGVLIFSFPKKLDNGQPAIVSDEKSVEFIYTQGKFTIKTAFELSKMAGSHGIDI